MEIYKLREDYLFAYLPNTYSFFIRLKQLGDIWLFNCFEGCQHILIKNKVKISQVKKIIITDNNIKNISGLLGLLSSISLNTKTDRIDIYAPKDLHKYIFWGRKYSQTNFRYTLYIHKSLEGLIASQSNINIYAFYPTCKINILNYSVILLEQPGPFNSVNAMKYQIPFGPLYGYFKMGKRFILPDGFLAYSKNFVCGYYLGSKFLFMNKYLQKEVLYLLNNYTFLLYP